MKPDFSYDMTCTGFLKRAKSRLDAPSAEHTVYAALELRLFLETRLSDYLDAQRRYAKSIPKGFKTAEQQRELQRISGGAKIQHLKAKFPDGLEIEMYHTPISDGVRRRVDKLSELLHAQHGGHGHATGWWLEKHAEVVRAYRLCWFCNQGNLLSPAMITEKRDMGDLAVSLAGDMAEDLKSRVQKGGQFQLNVRYLDLPPTTWRCDL